MKTKKPIKPVPTPKRPRVGSLQWQITALQAVDAVLHTRVGEAHARFIAVSQRLLKVEAIVLRGRTTTAPSPLWLADFIDWSETIQVAGIDSSANPYVKIKRAFERLALAANANKTENDSALYRNRISLLESEISRLKQKAKSIATELSRG